MSEQVVIDGRSIGPGKPPYIVAELSGNHNGDIDRALALIDAAKEAGADAVKLQTYTADTITLDHDGPGFVIEHGLWQGRRLYELYREAHTPWDWHEALFERARTAGIAVFSSPFDETAVDLLESLGAPAYKIASFEAIDLPLIRRCAETGKPLIISTGMANLEEIGDAVTEAGSAGVGGLILLHCTSGYPTPPDQMNLRTIADLADRFDVVTGLSDHTLGVDVPVAGIAQGAALIEKHVTLRRADGGPDAVFSLEPEELARMCEACRNAWAALGQPTYDRQQAEAENAQFRRSLYATADIEEGAALTPDNVRSIRPGFGLAPKHLPEVIGRRASRRIARGTPLDWDLLQ